MVHPPSTKPFPPFLPATHTLLRLRPSAPKGALNTLRALQSPARRAVPRRPTSSHPPFRNGREGHDRGPHSAGGIVGCGGRVGRASGGSTATLPLRARARSVARVTGALNWPLSTF